MSWLEHRPGPPSRWRRHPFSHFSVLPQGFGDFGGDFVFAQNLEFSVFSQHFDDFGDDCFSIAKNGNLNVCVFGGVLILENSK